MEEKELEQMPKGIRIWVLALILLIIVGLFVLFYFLKGTTIEGTIRDAVKGTPVTGASIILGTHSTTSDENGSFRLRVPKLEGEISVSAPGYESLSINVEKNLSLSLVPLPEKVASYWFNYWKEANYAGMYDLLTNDCKKAISLETFNEEFSRYKLEIVDIRTQKMETNDNTAGVLAEVDINTPLGKQTLRFSLRLLKEGGIWKVVWYSAGRGLTPTQPPL